MSYAFKSVDHLHRDLCTSAATFGSPSYVKMHYFHFFSTQHYNIIYLVYLVAYIYTWI